jgi:hypothetical protein
MWWENPDAKILEQFFEECHDFTRERMKKAVGNINRTWPFNHHLNSQRYPFEPKGAVISITNTPTVWDALRLYARQRFGVHFMISGHAAPKGYELLSQLPAAVYTPMRFDRTIPHGGFLSTRTWGFDLRLLGRLRPYFSATGQRPPTIFPENESEKIFADVDVSNPDLYYQRNLWTAPFEGNVVKFAGFWWEAPVQKQILTLLYILRALNNMYGLDPSLILPAHCIHRRAFTMPFMDWDFFRKGAVGHDHQAENLAAAYADVSHDIEYKQEESSTQEDELLKMMQGHDWRAETDDGGLRFIDSDIRPNDELMKFGRQSELLTALGFHGVDYRTSIRLFAVRERIPGDRINDAPPKLVKALERFYA